MNIHTHLFFCFLLVGCAGTSHTTSMPDDFVRYNIDTGKYTIATWHRPGTDINSPLHIYIEGDGHSFYSDGRPTHDPTPRGTLMRDIASMDNSGAPVIYMARPCQYIMSPACSVTDWTKGRFSSDIISAMADAVRKIADGRPVVLIGYSGGAMVSGLIIHESPDINVVKWITIAGVLNHASWTEYFGDSPLSGSLDMNELPHVPQRHYVAEYDRVVPISLTRRMAVAGDIIMVRGATHDNMDIKINFD